MKFSFIYLKHLDFYNLIGKNLCPHASNFSPFFIRPIFLFPLFPFSRFVSFTLSRFREDFWIKIANFGIKSDRKLLFLSCYARLLVQWHQKLILLGQKVLSKKNFSSLFTPTHNTTAMHKYRPSSKRKREELCVSEWVR